MLSDIPNIVFLVMSRSFALTSSNGATSHAKSANGQGHWLQVLAMIGGIVIQFPGSWHQGSPTVPTGSVLFGSSIHTGLLLLFIPHMSPYWHRSCCPFVQSGLVQDSSGSHMPLLLVGRVPPLFSHVSWQVLSPHKAVLSGHLGISIVSVVVLPAFWMFVLNVFIYDGQLSSEPISGQPSLSCMVL